jgi:electron transport complex protein RnfD
MKEPTEIRIGASPHIHSPDTTERIMWTVSATLLPAMAGAVYFFGIASLLVTSACIAGAMSIELLITRRNTLRDGSAVLTGLLLGMTLPASFPMWMAFIGGAFAIAVGKLAFGGLGQNIFNPSLIGRAFLQAAFPTAITTWPKVGQGLQAMYASNFALPFMQGDATHLITSATPLGMMKFEHVQTNTMPLLLGGTAGSLGETSSALIILGGLYLIWKRYLDWRIPLSIVLTIAVIIPLLNLISPERVPSIPFMLFSGGLMIGAMYMATDVVTSPLTHMGSWIYGAGIATLTALIRIWGGLPEGVMYAILLMNAVVPVINRLTQPKVFGVESKRRKEAHA